MGQPKNEEIPQLSENTTLSRFLQRITAFKLTLDETFPGNNGVEILVRGKVRATGPLLGFAETLNIPCDDQGELVLEINDETDFEKWLVLIKELKQKYSEYSKITPFK